MAQIIWKPLPLDLDTTIMPTDRLEEELNTLYKGIEQLEPPVCRPQKHSQPH